MGFWKRGSRATAPAPPAFQPFARAASQQPREICERWRPEFMAVDRSAPIVSVPGTVGNPVYLSSKLTELNEAYELIAAAFAAIHQVSTTASNLPITVYRRRKGADEPMNEHPLAEFLNPTFGRFNPWTTAQVGWYLTFAQHLLYGAAYLLKDAVFQGKPQELHLLRPEWVHPIVGADRPIGSWDYNVPGKRTTYSIEDVIPFPFPNPRDPVLPHVPLAAARRAMLLELYQLQFNEDFFKNGATLGGVITLKQPLDGTALKRVAAEFREAHSGPGNQGRWRFVGGAENVTELGTGMKDMQFDAGLKRTMQYVLMVCGVPPVVVGSLDGATYANAEAQIKQYLQGTIQPICRFRDSVINLYLARLWGEDLYVQTDFSRVEALLPGLDIVSNVVSKYWGSDLISFGEARQWIQTRNVPSLAADPERDPFYHSDLVPNAFAAQEPPAGGDGTAPPDSTPSSGRRLSRRRDSLSPIDRYLERVAQQDAERSRLERLARRKEKEQKIESAVQKELKRIQKAYRGNFAAQREAILEAIDAGRITYLDLSPVKELIDALRSDSRGRVEKAYQGLVQVFGDAAMADVGATVAFNAVSAPVLQYIAKNSAANVVLVDQTTADTVRTKIQDAILEAQLQGENLTETATRIMKDTVSETFTDMSRGRAARIAQTETTSMFNFTDFEAWKQSDVVESREWHTQEDDRVRSITKGDEFDHAAMDGVTAQLDQPFRVPRKDGGFEEIMFPGDPDGSAGNVIEDRCYMTANLTSRALVRRLCSQVEDATRSLAATAAMVSPT